MKTILICALLGAASISSTAALAQNDQAPAPAQVAAPVSAAVSPDPNDPDRIVCKAIVHEGALVPARRCLPAHTWDAERKIHIRQEVEAAERQTR